MTDSDQSEGKDEAVPTSADETPQGEPAPEEKPEVQEELPEGASDRTKEQFGKLKSQLATKDEELVVKNNELAEERAKNTQGSSVFDQFQPPQAAAQQPEGPNPFIQPPVQPGQPEHQQDPIVGDDGTVDIPRLNQKFDAAGHAEQSALQARDDIIRMEQNRQNNEAVTAYPELDPQSKEFSKEFFDMTSAAMAKNMIDGSNKTLKQVADEVSNFKGSDTKGVKEAKKEAVEQFKEGQENRQQGPMEEGVGGERQPDISDEDLRTATRVGSPEEKDKALDIRLKNAGVL